MKANDRKAGASGAGAEQVGEAARLKNAEWLMAPETQTVFAALNRDGHEARAVGGAVRNTLMGLPVVDVDIATTATPDEVAAMVEAAGLKAVATGLGHGTMTVIVNHHPFEVTTLRLDVETFGRHATVRFTQDWAEDARRRDFTMNALYAGADGTVYDPLGGLGDILARQVRFIGDARERIREDYLRILRFFRFNADYGVGPLDKDGVLACVRERNGLRELSAERVRAEMFRLFAAPDALRALEAMYDAGLLLEVLGAAPRLALFGRMAALESVLGLSPNPVRRLCAMAVMTPEDAERLAARLKLSRAESRLLSAMSRSGCPGWRGAGAGGRSGGGVGELARDGSEQSARLALYRLGREEFEARVLDAWARAGVDVEDESWRRLFELPERWTPPEFPIKGADLMNVGLKPGPELGEMLRRLEARWTGDDFCAGRDELLLAAKVEAAGE
jgi:poly(A) polymerase